MNHDLLRSQSGQLSLSGIIWLFTGTFLGVAAGFFLFAMGGESPVDSMQETTLQALQQERKQNRQLRSELERLRTGLEVDAAALRQSQTNITELWATINALQGEVALYKSVVLAAEQADGVLVHDIRINPLSSESYLLLVVLARSGESRDVVSGQLGVELVGKQGDQVVALPLSDISQQGRINLDYEFRFFQELGVNIQLPRDFQPEFLRLTLPSEGASEGKDARDIFFDWSGKRL